MTELGFKHNLGGAHAARTMMLGELCILMDSCAPEQRDLLHFQRTAEDENLLNKRSAKSRALTFRHLKHLYALDSAVLLFRGLSFFWDRDERGQPLMALSASLARDGLLLESLPDVLKLAPGTAISRESMESALDSRHPDHFSPATRRSIVQNVRSTLTQSGHLVGRVNKTRQQAEPTPGSMAYALFLSFVEGARGPGLFRTPYVLAQDAHTEQAAQLTEQAARRGWLHFKRVGDVMEVSFPQLLTARDMEVINEQN